MSDPSGMEHEQRQALLGLALNLSPGPGAAAADVTLARARLTSAVEEGQDVGTIAASVLLEANQLGKTATDIRNSQPGANRAFLSGLPTTLEANGGVPVWAHGMVVSAVAPPMLTVDRLPTQLHWIDPLVQMSMVRADDPTVLVTIDLPLRSRPGRSF